MRAVSLSLCLTVLVPACVAHDFLSHRSDRLEKVLSPTDVSVKVDISLAPEAGTIKERGDVQTTPAATQTSLPPAPAKADVQPVNDVFAQPDVIASSAGSIEKDEAQAEIGASGGTAPSKGSINQDGVLSASNASAELASELMKKADGDHDGNIDTPEEVERLYDEMKTSMSVQQVERLFVPHDVQQVVIIFTICHLLEEDPPLLDEEDVMVLVGAAKSNNTVCPLSSSPPVYVEDVMFLADKDHDGSIDTPEEVKTLFVEMNVRLRPGANLQLMFEICRLDEEKPPSLDEEKVEALFEAAESRSSECPF